MLLGGAANVTAPSEEAAARIREAVGELSPDRLTDPEALGKVLPIGEFLGPAALAYVAADDFRPVAPGELCVEQEPRGRAELDDVVRAADVKDADEAGLDEITSPTYVVRADGQAVAAAGYRGWPTRTAHLSVLTAPAWRGKGFARATGSAAVRHALDQNLLPQWRARLPASRRVAAGLGFSELGRRLSVELA